MSERWRGVGECSEGDPYARKADSPIVSSISTGFVDNPVDKLVAFAPSANGRLVPPKMHNF
jgi:hypothetical protein